MYVNPTTAVITLKTAANVGYKPQWVSSDTLSDYPLMLKISGGLWEGVITGNFGETPNSKTPHASTRSRQEVAPDERWGTFYLAGILLPTPSWRR